MHCPANQKGESGMSAWVVGGTSGIGAAIASKLGEMDESVTVTGTEVDVTSYDMLFEMGRRIYETARASDPLQSIYFCAGDTELEWLGMMGSIGCANQIGLMEVNAGGFINLMDVLVKLHTEYGTNDILPRVCAISSDAAERPMRTSIGYCASKAALNMAIRVAARELGPRGWTVFGIAPGMIDGSTGYGSKMTEYIDRRVPAIRNWSGDEALEYEKEQAVVKKPLRINPGTVARLAVEMVLDQGSHINGSIITFNGGR